MPKVELLLRLRLVKDALSSVLMNAGFTVFHEPTQGDNDTIAVIDFEDCKDPASVSAHQSRGVRIVALVSQTDSREIGLDEITPLSGILTYDLSAGALVRSLLLIAAGERIFPHDLALGRKSAVASPAHQSDGVRLSPREREILSYLVAGYPNKLIARHLEISDATVKVHLKSVQRKIRVENRTQAAIWALENLPELTANPSIREIAGPKSIPYFAASSERASALRVS